MSTEMQMAAITSTWTMKMMRIYWTKVASISYSQYQPTRHCLLKSALMSMACRLPFSMKKAHLVVLNIGTAHFCLAFEKQIAAAGCQYFIPTQAEAGFSNCHKIHSDSYCNTASQCPTCRRFWIECEMIDCPCCKLLLDAERLKSKLKVHSLVLTVAGLEEACLILS